MPNQDELELRVMEYGDMSSLVVEYPDYNSFGLPLISLGKSSGSGSWSTDFQKFQSTVALPLSSSSIGNLAGRAIIVTMKDGDLVAFGIIVNETLQHTPGGPAQLVNGVAMCENMQSTLQYRAFFTLSQTP